MKTYIIDILNEISDNEIKNFYIYMYGGCQSATCGDMRKHIYHYMRTYLKNHKLKSEFVDKYLIINVWMKEMEAKLKSRN